MKKEFRSILKYNGGLGALLCTECGKIIKTFKDFDEIEHQYLELKDSVNDTLNERVVNGYYVCDECKKIK